MIGGDEWDSMCLLIDEGWPGEFTDTAATAWRVFLDDYEPDQILRALKTLVARGGTFRPSVAEVVAEIRRDPSKPTAEEAYQMIYGPGGVIKARLAPGGSYGSEAEMLGARDQAKVDRAWELHPLLGDFVERFGIRRLVMLPVDDPEWGEKRREEVRAAWDRHCDAMDGRDAAAIAAGRGRRGGLGRLDPMAALGVKAPAAEEIEASR